MYSKKHVFHKPSSFNQENEYCTLRLVRLPPQAPKNRKIVLTLIYIPLWSTLWSIFRLLIRIKLLIFKKILKQDSAHNY